MSQLLLNPKVAASTLPFELPASKPSQFEPKADSFAIFLNKAQQTIEEKFGANRKEPAYKVNGFKKTESSYEAPTSQKTVSREAKVKTEAEPGTAKMDRHVKENMDDSAKTAALKSLDKDVKDEKTMQQMMEDDLHGQTSQNSLAAVLAQILQLLGVQNINASTELNSETGDLSQTGMESLQQIIDLLKSVTAQNNVKQANITAVETSAAKQDSTFKQELDALVSMLSTQNADAAQTFQSIIATQTGPDKMMDQKEILAAIARLIGDEKLSAQIMKDATISVKSLTATESNLPLPGLKDGSIPGSVIQIRDLNMQSGMEKYDAKADAQQLKASADSSVQVTITDGGTKPLNLPVLQTQLLVKGKLDNVNFDNPVILTQNMNQHMPNQVAEVGTNTVRVSSEELFSQIMEQAKVMVSNGRNEMEMNLKPENLGKIHLKVAMENQIVTAKFVAESQQVKEIIETNLSQLRSHLQENGIQVDSIMVSVGTPNQGQSFEQMANNQNGLNHSRNFTGTTQNNFMEKNEDADERRQPLHDSLIDLIA